VPEPIVIDNGTEFTTRAMDQWVYEHKRKLRLITPDKPMENGCDESFNRSTESSVRMPGRAPVPDCGGYARDYRRMEA